MKDLVHVWARLTSTAWAIQPEYLQTMCDIALRQNENPEFVAAKLGRDLDNTYDVTVRDGVAVLPVRGPLMRYASIFSRVSGATSYEMLGTDFTKAMEDPSVRAIVLSIDSPGGDANGVSDFAKMVFDARGKKPVVAHVGGTAASAAYWIAAAADKIVASETAWLGSIGAVITVQDTSEADAKSGRKTYEFVSSNSPYKRVQAGTKEGDSRLQGLADSMGEVFVETVAKFRGVPVETVLTKYGQGWMMVGKNAVEAGLADTIGTFESVMTDLIGDAGDVGSVFNPPGLGLSTSEVSTMSKKGDESGAAPEITVAFLTQNHPEIVAGLRDEGRAEGVASVKTDEIKAEAAKSERERIFSILNCEAAKGREKLARTLAERPGMSVDDAQAILANAAKETGNGTALLDAALSGNNPDLKPDQGGKGEEDPVAFITAAGKSVGIE